MGLCVPGEVKSEELPALIFERATGGVELWDWSSVV